MQFYRRRLKSFDFFHPVSNIFSLVKFSNNHFQFCSNLPFPKCIQPKFKSDLDKNYRFPTQFRFFYLLSMKSVNQTIWVKLIPKENQEENWNHSSKQSWFERLVIRLVICCDNFCYDLIHTRISQQQHLRFALCST